LAQLIEKQMSVLSRDHMLTLEYQQHIRALKRRAAREIQEVAKVFR